MDDPRKTYRVWVEIEEYDPLEDEYTTIEGWAVFLTHDKQEAFTVAAELEKEGESRVPASG